MKSVKSLLGQMFFTRKPLPQINIDELKANITMNLIDNNYHQFCFEFEQLVRIAATCENARDYVFKLHNEITGGATSRILGSTNMPLQYLKVTETNFRRYQEDPELNISSALSEYSQTT